MSKFNSFHHTFSISRGEIGVVLCDKINDNECNYCVNLRKPRLIIFICLYELGTEMLIICKHRTYAIYFNNTDSNIFDSLSFSIIFIRLYELRTEMIIICKHYTHATYFSNTDLNIFDSLSLSADNAAFG